MKFLKILGENILCFTLLVLIIFILGFGLISLVWLIEYLTTMLGTVKGLLAYVALCVLIISIIQSTLEWRKRK